MFPALSKSDMSPKPFPRPFSAAASIFSNGRLIAIGKARPSWITTRRLVTLYTVARPTAQA